MKSGGIIYKWTCEKTGLSYIGKTVTTLKQRLKGHVRAAETGSIWEFPKAIREYGIKSFVGTVLCECETSDELHIKERQFISEHNTVWPHGYNMTNGGEGPCELTRKLISERTREAMALLGPEHKKRQKEAMKDLKVRKKISDRTRAAMQRPEVIANTESGWSDRCTKISKTLKGHVVSEETRKKISEKLKSRPKKQRQIATCCSCRRQFTMTKKNQKYCSPKCYFARKKQ